MHPVAAFDAISSLASLAALTIAFRGWNAAFVRDARLLFVGLLAITLLYNVCLVVEWFGISNSLDRIEDFIGALVPMWWAFAFYFLLQDMTSRDLRQSEEKYRTILDSIEDGYYELDTTGNFTYFNGSLCRIFGNSGDGLLRRNIREFTDQNTAKRGYEVFNRVYTTEIPIRGFDWEVIRKDGTKRHVEASVSLMKNTADRPIGFRGIIRDVSDRSQAEQALKKEKERFRVLVEESPLAVSLISKDGHYKYINPRFIEMFGYKLEDIPNGREWFEKAYPDPLYRKQAITAWKTDFGNLQTGESGPRSFSVQCKDGSEKLINFRAVKMGSGDQFVIYDDITKRESTEQALRESEAKYRELVQNANSIIIRTDTHGNITFFNEFAQSFFDYCEENVLGKNLVGTIVPEKDMLGRDLKAMIQDILIHPEKYAVNENENMRSNGERVWVAWTNKAIRDKEGKITGFLCIGNDITSRKLLEEQLRQAQKTEAIGTLAGGIAHDFNNLLMGIQGNTSLMLHSIESSNPHSKLLRNIQEQVKSGARLTSQLLGYARKGKYEVKPLSLNRLVVDTAGTLGRARKDILIHQELSEDLFAIEADQGQIEQVLLNLYVNAADAMSDGGELTIKTRNVTHEDMKGKSYDPKPGNYVMLTVTDTGVGMDKRTMERIFDPFFTTKEMGRGTGLGLASVYGIIKGHAGYIDDESNKDNGTTFIIYIPASNQKVQSNIETHKIVEGTGTVLLVDDEEMVLDVGLKVLESLGYTVLSAKSGSDAVKTYEEKKDQIDMIILDLIMPQMGGGETFDRLKKINPDVRVLLSSGYSIDGQAKEILKRGCDGFIQKPFSMEELSGKIGEMLDKHNKPVGECIKHQWN